MTEKFTYSIIFLLIAGLFSWGPFGIKESMPLTAIVLGIAAAVASSVFAVKAVRSSTMKSRGSTITCVVIISVNIFLLLLNLVPLIFVLFVGLAFMSHGSFY